MHIPFLNNTLSLALGCVAGLLLSHPLYSQSSADSAQINLQPVQVKVYFLQQPLMSVTSSTHIISDHVLQQQSTGTLTSALNTVPGIRMEERSPGSYRLAMRGSLIRSPFGIRNTKIYIDEFPLTDAGGNTYLNLLDPYGIASLTVIKGPDGSLFGANSGGIIQIDPKGFGAVQDNLDVLLTGGSFGLFQEQLSFQQKISDKYQFSFDQSFLRSDGYRDQTALHRKTFQTAHQWQYSPKNQLRLFALYTDLDYQTPGGLTQAQFDENSKMSRPAAGPNPGAKEQQAAIYNKTAIVGITHTAQIKENLSHTVSLFGSNTDFENPFITNYEFRNEKNLGTRTYFSWHKDGIDVAWQMQVGTEAYWGWNERKNYDNEKGTPGATQDEDRLDNFQLNVFYRAMARLWDRWTIEGSIGYNKNTIHYVEDFPVVADPKGTIDFAGIWMPRIATSYAFSDNFTWRASVAKGYSTPTLEEIRPSDRIINTDLQAETGVNIETGFRYALAAQKLLIDLTAYRYNMQNGIVRRVNELGEDYYVNAGGMKQKGVEISVWANVLTPRTTGVLRALSVQSAAAYQHYRFGEYQVDDKDYSGNKMTAVPEWTWSNALQVRLWQRYALNIQHYFMSDLPLDDGNTVFAAKYHLLQAKLNVALPQIKRMTLHVFAGGDNLLDERYSLGNDINAFGGRYFNPAAGRNFYAGVRVGIK
ncbi:TonB-dependent receptor [Sphingobacterium sp. SGG-5]|uniref:TonB-dependent receptor n=1 Tax=Sphingobacterium sp. SGG-5 TaxID=2710881 RepID=UPI0013EA2C83|nr:TonB-dependent receptor [Sphingobacterium sp. SGG-5]NGM62044.1 TonB-dependent receptor [Sphingobacterium sp. SGG-5]